MGGFQITLSLDLIERIKESLILWDLQNKGNVYAREELRERPMLKKANKVQKFEAAPVKSVLNLHNYFFL
jgi:hypothetical protein